MMRMQQVLPQPASALPGVAGVTEGGERRALGTPGMQAQGVPLEMQAAPHAAEGEVVREAAGDVPAQVPSLVAGVGGWPVSGGGSMPLTSPSVAGSDVQMGNVAGAGEGEEGQTTGWGVGVTVGARGLNRLNHGGARGRMAGPP